MGWIDDAAPWSYALLAAAVLIVGADWTPVRRWVPCAAVALVAMGLEAGRFDGEPHLTEKFDATTLVWAHAVAMRPVAGIAAIVLAVPIGRATEPLLGRKKAILAGLATVGPVGLGALGSGGVLLMALERAFELVSQGAASANTQAEAEAIVRAAIRQSEWMIATATTLSLASAGWVSVRLFRWRSASTRDSSE